MEDLDLHQLCIMAIEKMLSEGISRHITYAHPEDGLPFDIAFNERVPKVTIEFVDPKEIEPIQENEIAK